MSCYYCLDLTLCYYGFLPTVLEAVLEAAWQNMHAVPCQNRSPLNIGYGFYFFDRFNTL